jgi:hypothetical protein
MFGCNQCSALVFMQILADWIERAGMQKTIALNENGRRVGESHPRAKLLDCEVHLALELLDAGLSYAEVAAKFDVSKSCIAHIATGRRRAQLVDRLVRVSVST